MIKVKQRKETEPCPSCGLFEVCVACELDIYYVKRMVDEGRPWMPRGPSPLFDSERERLITEHGRRERQAAELRRQERERRKKR